MKLAILLAGDAGSGKDFSADLVENYINTEFKELKVKRLSFGDVLKEICFDITNKFVPSRYLPSDYSIDYYYDPEKKNEVLSDVNMNTPRHIMQYIGTDIIRKYQPDFFARALARKIKEDEDNNVVYLIADLRFPNEYEAVNEICETYTIRVYRENNNRLKGEEKRHISENSLKEFKYDFEFDNKINSLDPFFSIYKYKLLMPLFHFIRNLQR